MTSRHGFFIRGSRGSKNLWRLRSWRFAVTASALSVVFAYSGLACRSDRRESFYSSFSDAKKDGAIDRGWIPDFLPETSHNIHELHDTSASTTWCAFEFLPNDNSGLKKQLETPGRSSSLVKRVIDPRKSWWPSFLTGDLDLPTVHAAGFEVYVVVEAETASTNDALLFAINWKDGRGFFFRTPLG